MLCYVAQCIPVLLADLQLEISYSNALCKFAFDACLLCVLESTVVQ